MENTQTQDSTNDSNSIASDIDFDSFLITTIRPFIIGQEMHENTEIFKIHITDNFHKKSWEIEKDHSDFNILYNKLSSIFFDIPSLPQKQILNLYDVESINKKRIIYQQFLNICTNRKDIYSSNEFKSFLELQIYAPDLFGNTPLLGGELEFLPKSVTDFKFIEEDNINIIILTTAEMGVNKIITDERILNFKNRLQTDNEEIIHNNSIQGMTIIF